MTDEEAEAALFELDDEFTPDKYKDKAGNINWRSLIDDRHKAFLKDMASNLLKVKTSL